MVKGKQILKNLFVKKANNNETKDFKKSLIQ